LNRSRVTKVKRTLRRYALRSRDITNALRYGPKAPRYAELIWVRPGDIRHALVGRSDYVKCSGKVIDIEAHFRLVDLESTPRMQSSFAHWADGVPWEDTRDYAVMLDAIRRGKDWAGCRSEEDLSRRYEGLDAIFEEARSSRRLKTRQELDPKGFREEGGILICIGGHGEPLLYDGFHRLAIALILNLPVVPAQLGYVDRNAVDSLERYRTPPPTLA
jgi:hypothetical protein